MKPNGPSKTGTTTSAPPAPRVAGDRDPQPFQIGIEARFPGADRSAFSQIDPANLGVGIMVTNADGTITLVNAAARRLSQMDPDGKVLGFAPSIWGEMLDVKGRHVPARKWPCVKALGGVITSNTECRLVRRDGTSRDILFGACPIRDAESQIVGVLSSLIDISKHKQKEFALREHAVLHERSRIAGDMHDTVVQGLNAVVLQLQVAEEEILERPEQARQRLRRARDVARESLAEARRSMWTLCQECFDDEDPAISLAFVAKKLFAGTPVKLRFSLGKGTCAIPTQMRTDLLRIGKEALSNILKHARATTVTVELACLEQELRLSVVDDGRGFMSEFLPSGQGGFGLFGMRRRAERLGGKLVVDSRRERGTQVVAHLPLPPHLHGKCA